VFGIFDSETGWLGLMNIALGLAVLVCLFALGRVLLRELRGRLAKHPSLAFKRDGHPLNLESLGITLHDGGEPINETTRRAARNSGSDDPPNIIRSDN